MSITTPIQEIEGYPNIEGRIVAADVEATGVSWVRDKVFGVAIAFREGGTIFGKYLDLRKGNNLDYIKDQLPKVKLWVNHYIKYDAHMLRQAGVAVPLKRMNCTMIREAILDENKYDYTLDTISRKYLGAGKADIWPRLAELFGGQPTKEAQIGNLVRAPEALVAEYAIIDAARALEVWEAQEHHIEEQELHSVHTLEHRLLPVVIDMEHRGVRVDRGRAEEGAYNLRKVIRDNQVELNRIAGRELNVNSGPQVKEICGVHQEADGQWYTGDGIKLDKTAKGGASLDSVKLQQCTLPAAGLIADQRGLIKAHDVFLNKYILEMSHDDYIHASINQTRTEDGNGIYTGRLSISEPALQQIHKRNKKMAAIVRACFVPDPDQEWWCYDWSQMDFRIFASYLNDPRINSAYADNPLMDFHGLVASLTGLPRDRDQRTGGANAKQINLACVFGMGAGELAKQCNLPYTLHSSGRYLVAGPEAKALFAKYHDNIPGVRRLQRDVESVAKTRFYIKTQIGRRIRFEGGYQAHKAAGLLYQMAAADAMKMKMCQVAELLEGTESRLMMTVHDEFDITASPGDKARGLDKEIKELLQRFDTSKDGMRFRVPIIADFGSGSDWWEASK